MKITATQKFTRAPARKIRFVTKALKGLTPAQALTQLRFINSIQAQTIAKVINQAVSNATNNHNIPAASQKIASIEINEGPTYKRFRAVSRGRAHSIMKRTSHIKVTLEATATTPTTKLKSKTSKPTQIKTTTNINQPNLKTISAPLKETNTQAPVQPVKKNLARQKKV